MLPHELMDISTDKLRVLETLEAGFAYVIDGEAGTGKTFLGLLCGDKLLREKRPWQQALYLTYSKLAKWQIDQARQKAEKDCIIDRSCSKRMDVKNFHSLWWDLIRKYHAFLGISDEPRICLTQELRSLAEESLKNLTLEDRQRLIPSYFLTNSGEYDARIGRYDKLNSCMQGEALLYAVWGAEKFGKRAYRFVDQDDFLSWARDVIERRNRQGLFSHSETVWWARRLVLKHPTIAEQLRATYPILIMDEFQDIDVPQCETTILLLPDTSIIMGDTKQTIHVWRGANPEQRFNDLLESCNSCGKYKGIIEHSLTIRNRSANCMSAPDQVNNNKIVIDNGSLPQQKGRCIFECKKQVLSEIRRATSNTVAILCSSNLLADGISEYLRKKNTFSNNRSFPPIHCTRHGADNSPLIRVREVVIQFLVLVYGGEENRESVRHVLANDFLMDIIPVRLHEVKSTSRGENRERWEKAGAITSVFYDNFGKGLIAMVNFTTEIARSKQCHCDRLLVSCLRHLGKGVRRIGDLSWERLTIHEKRRHIDAMVLQYENATAKIVHECRISVMTVHQSKGREFDTVIIPWFSVAKWDERDSFSWDTSDGEVVNIFHTACTRAKEKVIVIAPKGLEAQWPPL